MLSRWSAVVQKVWYRVNIHENTKTDVMSPGVVDGIKNGQCD